MISRPTDEDVISLPFSVLEVLEGDVLDVRHQVLVSRVELQLFEHIDQHQTEDKLHRKSSSLL